MAHRRAAPHILSALVPHLRTHLLTQRAHTPSGGIKCAHRPFPECCCVFQISPLHCSLKSVVNLEWPLHSLFFPPVAHQGVSQLGMSTSFSKIYPCVAHKRVSQVEMATSFSKLYPRVAHQRVSQLGRATFFSKLIPLHGPQKGESS